MKHVSLLAIGLVAASTTALADGAFPVATQVFVPESHPNKIILASNQGLFLSEDDGANWRFMAEIVVNGGVELVGNYELGTDGTLYAVAATHIYVSRDLGCSWARGVWPPGVFVTDVFPDPVDPARVFALGHVDQTHSVLLVSTDRAANFAQTLYSEPAGLLLGVENARSSPSTVYLAGSRAPPDGGASVRYLGQSIDGGPFALFEHSELGSNFLGIIRVDPQNPDLVYLRAGYFGTDALYAGADGGASLSLLLQLAGEMTGFTQTADGTLWVGERSGHLWSAPVGGPFAQRPGPQFACLASRGESLFACGNGLADGFDLGRSDDHGVTFQRLVNIRDPLMFYLEGGCDFDGGTDAGMKPKADGGSEHDAGSSSDGGPDAGTVTPPPGKRGCGCDSGAGASAWLCLWALLRCCRERRVRLRLD